MKTLKIFLKRTAVLLFLSAIVFSRPTTAYALELKSPAFDAGEYIPVKYSGSGEDLSPPLAWENAPAGTKSFVLIVADPDAPSGMWVHWIIYNIPAGTKALKEGIPPKKMLPDRSLQGMNSFRKIGYGGPCPPPGPAHRYYFRLYALDSVLRIPAGIDVGKVMDIMEGHIIDEASLMATFGR